MARSNAFAHVRRARLQAGVLDIEELLELHGPHNSILDACSTLVSTTVVMGKDNTLYPGVLIMCSPDSELVIGSGNTFYPGTLLLAEGSGQLAIGDENQFGDGGCRIKANRKGSRIVIGSHGRYLGGVEIVGDSRLGHGTQVIGAITVQDCKLAGGEPFTGPDPDRRGGVLKGAGLARGIHLDVGEVVNAIGAFADRPIERQAAYHPRTR
jgi:hypothetical protein